MFRPLIAALMVFKKSINVVILIPLPVDPGDEPIRPTSMIKNMVADENQLNFQVINPQLLNDIAWKMALAHLRGNGRLLRCCNIQVQKKEQRGDQ